MKNLSPKIFFAVLAMLAVTGIWMKFSPFFRTGKVLGVASVNSQNPAYQSDVSKYRTELEKKIAQSRSIMDDADSTKKEIDEYVVRGRDMAQDAFSIIAQVSADDDLTRLSDEISGFLAVAETAERDAEGPFERIVQLARSTENLSITSSSDIERSQAVVNNADLYVTEMEVKSGELERLAEKSQEASSDAAKTLKKLSQSADEISKNEKRAAVSTEKEDAATEKSDSSETEESATDSPQGESITIEIDEEAQEDETESVDGTQDEGKKERTVRVEVATDDPGSRSVELYAKPRGKEGDLYLGRGEKDQGSDWNVGVDSNSLPDGEYRLYAVVENQDGRYTVVSPYTISVSDSAPDGTSGNWFPSTIDTDGDGLPDNEEERLGTDALVSDTDGDGFPDGEEVDRGFDPKNYSPGDKRDKVVFQSPKLKGAVGSAFRVETAKMKPRDGAKKEESLTFTGKANPNAFVTLYIYSDDPIIVMVRTDKDGNWSYELDKNLDNGFHEVYVAVTDNAGRITAKSEPFRFIKTAQAVERVDVSEEDLARRFVQNESPLERSRGGIMLFGFILSVFCAGLAFLIIGRMTSRSKAP